VLRVDGGLAGADQGEVEGLAAAVPTLTPGNSKTTKVRSTLRYSGSPSSVTRLQRLPRLGVR